MRLSELDYDLPPSRIANEPVEPRDAARLLVLDAERLVDRTVADLPALLPPSLLLVNDTRVLAARVFGRKPTGAKVELLFVERLAATGTEERWLAMSKSSKPLSVGGTLELEEGAVATIVAKREDGTIEVVLPVDVESWLERVGSMPLPPYIERVADERDRERYQTVFASQAGAVAAPTAGLHFTPELLERLRAAGHRIEPITLHVGPGTFRPVKVDDLDDHPMHEESYVIPATTATAVAEARREGRRVMAIGTTVVRAVESAADDEGSLRVGAGRTRLLIQPGYRFRVVEAMLSNFHLPRSTLLALVMAFAGVERTRAAYAHAVRENYRFFSYGDAMLVPLRQDLRA